MYQGWGNAKAQIYVALVEIDEVAGSKNVKIVFRESYAIFKDIS